jgi:hypothetical protein
MYSLCPISKCTLDIRAKETKKQITAKMSPIYVTNQIGAGESADSP